MDRSSKATAVFRVGTVLVAMALAFGLISYMSNLTVSGYHGDARPCIVFFYYECGTVDEAPPGTFTVLASWNPTSPQQMYFFNMSSMPVDAEVYLLKTNQTTFDVWIADESGLPLANVSLYGPHELVWFSDYVASHGQEVMSQYDVSRANVVVKYFVPDFKPLMFVVTNRNAQSSLNFTYFATNIGITINPSLGFRVAGYLAASGAVLAAFGVVLKRRRAGSTGGGPISTSASP